MKKCIISLLLLSFVIITQGCGKNENSEIPLKDKTGTIFFTANGEDFVRKGFIDKQGWRIEFDKLFVNIRNPRAYIPESDMPEVILKGSHWVDLAEGGKDASPILLGKVENVKAGNYQSLKFNIRKTKTGEYKGYSIVMKGKAYKKDKSVDFIIKFNEEIDYHGRDGFVGDEVKGLLLPCKSTTVEMTFHFDHIFGDAEAKADDHINIGSVGFDFFNRFAKKGCVDISQTDMESSNGYNILVKAIWTLGHLGEGHCEWSNQSSLGKIDM
ncbi:MAG: DUF4382 domain-containing protein [Spirochaetota bacterium]|nr:DUF4382 domain-containing protein [Spirochaetota bacterium]